MDAFSRLKKNMAAQKYEASLNKKGKRRNPKIKKQMYLARTIGRSKARPSST